MPFINLDEFFDTIIDVTESEMKMNECVEAWKILYERSAYTVQF